MGLSVTQVFLQDQQAITILSGGKWETQLEEALLQCRVLACAHPACTGLWYRL